MFFSVFIGLIALGVALPLRNKSIKESKKRTRKAIKKLNPDMGEEEVNMIMTGIADGD